MGKYHTRLLIGKYQRPTPFNRVQFTPNIVVFLPIPNELRDDTSVGYTNVNLETVGDLINTAGAAGFGAAALRNAGNMVNALGGVASTALGSMAGAAAQSDAVQKVVEGALNGLGSLFPPEQITSALQQSAGLAPNPNPSVQFQGPVLRDFSYTWAFYPKNKSESITVQNLIKILKRSALPRNSFQNSAAILDYPDMCQINFFPWDEGGSDTWAWSENSIIKYKKCVMQNVNVNYNPFGTPAFFEDSHLPVSYQITISFKEIEYMLSEDWKTSQLPPTATPRENSIGTVLGEIIAPLNPFTDINSAASAAAAALADGTAQ
jgi:hypothetical protein